MKLFKKFKKIKLTKKTLFKLNSFHSTLLGIFFFTFFFIKSYNESSFDSLFSFLITSIGINLAFSGTISALLQNEIKNKLWMQKSAYYFFFCSFFLVITLMFSFLFFIVGFDEYFVSKNHAMLIFIPLPSVFFGISISAYYFSVAINSVQEIFVLKGFKFKD